MMACEELVSDNLGFDPGDDLVNAFYYTSGEELEEWHLDTDEEEDMDFYDLYENLRLTRPPSPLIDEVSSDEESLVDEDHEEKKQARYSTSTVKGFIIERVNASESTKEFNNSVPDESSEEKKDANPEQNELQSKSQE